MSTVMRKKTEQLNKDRFIPPPPNPHKKSKFPKRSLCITVSAGRYVEQTAQTEVSKWIFFYHFYPHFYLQTNLNLFILSIRSCRTGPG